MEVTKARHPRGRWELLSVSAHMGSCIPVDRGRRYRDRARIDVDTASLQTTSNCEFPMGAFGTFEDERAHSQLCSH